MEKQNGKKKSPKNTRRPKVLQISDDEAAGIIGGIVEKGISEGPQSKPFIRTQPPKPSVLPFPVARHRSHGPHWGPIGSKSNDNDRGENDEDDKVFRDFDSIAAFANPVQRKETKNLNLSRWKELMQDDNTSVTNQIEKKLKNGEAVKVKDKRETTHEPSFVDVDMLDPMEINVEPRLNACGHPTKTGEAITRESGAAFCSSIDDMEVENFDQSALLESVKDVSSCKSKGELGKRQIGNLAIEMDVSPASPEMPKKQDQKVSTSPTVSGYNSNNLGNEQGSMSLESQIDAENRAQLQSMSPDEIAQARSEIMEKIDPSLLKILKKRGQDKLKMKTCSNKDLATNGEPGILQSENQITQDTKSSSHSESDISHMVTTAPSKDTQGGLNKNIVQNSAPASNSLWNTWSERVEAVRELRFSLDGNVIERDFILGPEIGNISDQNRHNADNITERDFLRTEGDPGAAGYTIKEAVALTRSVVPGQRALALHLLASVLDRALHSICQIQVGRVMKNYSNGDVSIDWEAVWAYALGPEPELVLSLRMSLDDNHHSVVLACAKVIQCVLSCDVNENFFDISEKTATYAKDIYTAPVFRSRPEIDVGFLHGGFWKYSTKPSNIIPSEEDAMDDMTEGKHTIQDDIVIAGQDFAAGLVRMGILPRLCYLLENDPTAPLEECIISILIAIARHSPTCANAIMQFQRLVQIVVHRFTKKDNMEIRPSKIKSISLLKVLARSDKKNCIGFIKTGIFQDMTWHLYQPAFSLNQWAQSGKENCKLSSALMVEQLRFWRIFIQYGYCVSYFSDFFPALCLWLNPPTFEKLTANKVLSEFASISKEAFLVLEALAGRLPNVYSQKHLTSNVPECADHDMEIWSWNYVAPMVDSAVKWMVLKSDPYISKLFELERGTRSDIDFQDISVTPLLWVISAAMQMISRVLERVTAGDTISLRGSGARVPWLPEFVPKVGLEIIKNGILQFSGANNTEYGADPAGGRSFIEELCHLRQQSDYETSLASVCCIHGLVQVIISTDNLIQLAKTEICCRPSQVCKSSREGKVLEDGMLQGSMVEMRSILNIFMKIVASEWHSVQSIEIFGRGGPAPGVGLGWGASSGGFWSLTVLLAQIDAGLLVHLLEIVQIVPVTNTPTADEMTFTMLKINSIIGVCLTGGPRDRVITEKAFNILLQIPVLKYFDFCIHHFLPLNKGIKLYGWEYKEEDYLFFSKILASHFRDRWLCVKRKSKAVKGNSSGNKTFKKGSVSLETIHEDMDSSNMTSQGHYDTSLVVEWAHQRLPLPMHWFLSPISTICDSKSAGLPSASNKTNFMLDPADFLDVAKGGLFFLLGIEAACFPSTDVCSPVQSLPLVWKLHSLSVSLLSGMGLLEEERSRDVYSALQELYGQRLDEARFRKSAEFDLKKNMNLLPETGKKHDHEFLRFQTEIHDSYSTFIETLVDQFAAVSYGDLIYGRQVAIYLHRHVEAPVRLAAWNALSNACVLELLPPIEKCLAQPEGYLEPVEDNEGILEAYGKSWTSGALDRAATRRSAAFTLVLHHLSSFIFLHAREKLLLRNKLARSLLRGYSRKQQHEGMMLEFIQYNKPFTSLMTEQKEGSLLQSGDIQKRLGVLIEACEGNSALLTQVEKLKSSLVKNSLL